MKDILNEPAFPSQELGADGRPISASSEGMTLRDYFAAQAIAFSFDRGCSFEALADDAYTIADEMLKRRLK